MVRKRLTDPEIAVHVRRFKEQGDERALGAVLEHFEDRLVRKAMTSGGRVDVDVSDLVSAGRIGLFKAIGEWDPDRGIPLGAFAKLHIHSAMMEARSELSGAFRASRKQQGDRAQLINARAALAREQRLGTAPEEPAPRLERRKKEQFKLDPKFTAEHLAALTSRGTDPEARELASKFLGLMLRQYLRDELVEPRGSRNKESVAANAIVHKVVNYELARLARAGAAPRSIAELEQTLQARTDYLVAKATRQGGVRAIALSAPRTSMKDHTADLAARANVSEFQARKILESLGHTVSLEAKLREGSDENRTVGEVLGDESPNALDAIVAAEEEAEAERSREQRAARAAAIEADQWTVLRDAVQHVPAEGRALVVLALGLDGEAPAPPSEVAAALGVAVDRVSVEANRARSQYLRVLRTEPAIVARVQALRAVVEGRASPEQNEQPEKRWSAGSLMPAQPAALASGGELPQADLFSALESTTGEASVGTPSRVAKELRAILDQITRETAVRNGSLAIKATTVTRSPAPVSPATVRPGAPTRQTALDFGR